MKNVSKLKIFSFAAAVLLALSLCAVAAITFAPKSLALADGAEINSSDIESYYYVGSDLSLPQSAGISFDGETYTGSYSALITPDGNVTTRREIKLSKTGDYSAVYAFSVSGTSYKARKDFKVMSKNWQVVSAASNVEYGNVTTGETTDKGLIITLADGDTFTYNVPVDLRKAALTDFITFYPEQIERKMYQRDNKLTYVNFDAEYVTVTLTDCYDPSIYVTCMIYYDASYKNSVYVRTSASEQGEFGLYLDCPFDTQPSIYVDGLRYGVYEGKFGQTVQSVGTPPPYYKWAYDSESKRVYFKEAQKAQYLVNDLDYDAISVNKFGGFTTGEVYVSVSASNFYTSSTKIQIEAIGEMRGEDLIAGYYEDDIAPTVVVDAGDAHSGFYIKNGEEVTLFAATAYDVNLTGGVKVNVYYNYGTSFQSSVLIKNGKFTPSGAGTYGVEYSAKDTFGNKGKSVIYLYCIDTDVVSFTAQKLATLTAGVESGKLEYTARSENGDVTVDIKAVCDDGTVYSIDKESLTFTPLGTGTYTIVYTYSDKVKTYDYKYDVQCAPNPKYAFFGKPDLPKYYIKGADYSIDDFTAYSLTGKTPQAVETSVFARFYGGEYVKISDLSSFNISGTETVRFKYVAGDAVYETDDIKIIDVGFDGALRIADYFVSDDMETVPEYDYIDFNSTVSSGTSRTEFINRLSPALFSMEFAIPTAKAKFGTFSIVLSDCADERNKIAILYETINGALNVSVGGGKPYVINGRIDDGMKRTVRYDAAAGNFYFSDLSSTTSVPFEFDFESNYCMMAIEFGNVRTGAGFTLYSLQNQLIGNRTYDGYAPQIYCKESSGYVEIGTTATAYVASVSDVLSPWLKSELTLSVIAPDGGYVTDNNGVILNSVTGSKDYVFTLSSYGVYYVEYHVRDESGNPADQSYRINVADMVAPTITFEDDSGADTVQSVKLGYKYKVKDYSVSDNYSSAENIFSAVYIFNKNGLLVSYGSDEYTFTETGDYTVYVYCFDEAGNYAYAFYKVKVA